jgi:hypothetical protein
MISRARSQEQQYSHAVDRRQEPVVTGIVGTTEIEILAGVEEETEIATGPYRTLTGETPTRRKA